jgi:hypothetical protein
VEYDEEQAGMSRAAERVALGGLEGLIQEAFEANGFHGVMQACRKVLERYDDAFNGLESQVVQISETVRRTTGATHISLTAVPELRQALKKDGILALL